MNILITGSDGFIGKNLSLYFSEVKNYKLSLSNRNTSQIELENYILSADWIFHLAGINRPKEVSEFQIGNVDSTRMITEILLKSKKSTPIVYTSSTQAELENPYGVSKKTAEEVLIDYSKKSKSKAFIYRFPNVFGKFAKPNYNSVVATFCHNIARSIPIEIHEPNKKLTLIFIEDVCKTFKKLIENSSEIHESFQKIDPQYSITLQELADKIYEFKNSRMNLKISQVGEELNRALYSTYISYTPIAECKYSISEYKDTRGRFVEMLKTESSGQFSFFTAPPGVTRGRHYHHTKTEKFLIIQGRALFRFQHRLTKEFYEITVDGSVPEIVDTIPGWTHDITNQGDNDLIVMLWANEVFDRENPDTYYADII